MMALQSAAVYRKQPDDVYPTKFLNDDYNYSFSKAIKLARKLRLMIVRCFLTQIEFILRVIIYSTAIAPL